MIWYRATASRPARSLKSRGPIPRPGPRETISKAGPILSCTPTISMRGTPIGRDWRGFPPAWRCSRLRAGLRVGYCAIRGGATLLGKAEERAPSDAETHYYRGIAETALEHPAEARTELEAAHNSPSFQAA